MSSTDAAATGARWLYRRMLRLYPPAFRARYGGAMEELFAELLEDSKARRRPFGVLAVAVAGLLDGARRAVVERRRDARARRRGEPTMTSWLSDLRYALRSFSRQPGTTALVVAMLAIGVAANTAVFSLLNGLFLRPLPFPDAERLVYLNETAPKWNLTYVGINYPDFHLWRDQATAAFEGMALHEGASFNVAAGERSERVEGARVTHDLLSVLGVEPVLGRVFSTEEDRPDGPRVAMIGYALWQEWFAGAADVVGTTIRVNSEPHEIVGVLPAGCASRPPRRCGCRSAATRRSLTSPTALRASAGCDRGCRSRPREPTCCRLRRRSGPTTTRSARSRRSCCRCASATSATTARSPTCW